MHAFHFKFREQKFSFFSGKDSGLWEINCSLSPIAGYFSLFVTAGFLW